jgi:hypothetical protein
VAVEPGWYPDPAGSSELRFWDGNSWTSQTAAPVPPTVTAPPTFSPPHYPPETAPYGQAPAGGTYGQPQIAPYGFPGQQPRKRSRLTVLLVVLGSVVGLGVIAAIITGVVNHQKDKSIYDRTSIAMPQTLQGLTKAGGSAADTVNDLTSSIPFPGAHLGGLYQKPDGTRAAVLIIGKIQLSSARETTELQHAETGFHSSQTQKNLAPTAFHNVDPGPLGGKMRCTTWTIQTVRATTCFFADAGAFGTMVLPTPDADAFAVRLRSGIEKRS